MNMSTQATAYSAVVVPEAVPYPTVVIVIDAK